MRRKLALLFAVAGLAIAAFATAAPAHATGACVHVSVTINGTNQTIDRCAP